MPPKKRIPAPIDRPLSRAYVRGFTGWSTAHTPGMSEPNSLRVMENVIVDRNGALAVRPGLRYLSYAQAPDMDKLITKVPGVAFDRPLIGTQEPFYIADGSKALLFAVREVDGTVGFRAILFTGTTTVVHALTDPKIGFRIPQGTSALNFSAATTHVEYLQINNRIVALSDAGEAIRVFFVGAEKVAKKMVSITAPAWEDGHKLSVVHPNATWVNKQTTVTRHNVVHNSGFNAGALHWSPSSRCGASSTTAVDGHPALALTSTPLRTNMQTSPLHDVSATGVAGWHPHQDWGNPRVTADKDWMRVFDTKGKGLFLAYGARLSHGVVAGQRYQVALDYEIGSHVEPVVILTFYSANGAKIGNSTSLDMPKKNGRYASSGVQAPPGTTTMRVSVGGRNEASTSTHVRVKNVMLCREEEVTTFFYGGSGADYFWAGAVNASPSVYHPPADISISCARGAVPPGRAACASLFMQGTAKPYSYALRVFNKDGGALTGVTTTGAVTAGAWHRAVSGSATISTDAVQADMLLTLTGVARGEVVYIDSALLEPGVSVAGGYFDGSTPATDSTLNNWTDRNAPFESPSYQTVNVAIPPIPPANTPTAGTLVAAGGAAANTYKLGFFYTFESEVGESAASKITEIRVMRPWSNWRWETPNAEGGPSGTPTDNADLCADQLGCIIPEAVYNQALVEGAVKWNLYAFAWSDQEPVPVVALLVGEKDLYPDATASLNTATALPHKDGGFITVTPSRRVSAHDAILPTRTNRKNYSNPPRSRSGLVAGDRLILVGDPTELGTIRWTSNRMGDYTNLTASKGGGAKTLVSGNLLIPAAVVLWQNPQSVDTLTILCMGADGQSSSYYMNPATVTSQSSGIVAVMGFEETTSTPGTMSPYGAEVNNNALYRPIDRALLKSTAQNYNINHKTMTDKIANKWTNLLSKQWVMSAVLDNRMFYLVHNPEGELLEPGCKGNEIWMLDLGIESNPWSRMLVQGTALRVFNVGPRTYVGVTRPEGLYYFDPAARLDDYVGADKKVLQRPIPWKLVSNTQGANRAHDAWAHLQQVGVTFGNFKGTARYGVTGWSIHGTQVDVHKQFTDDRPIEDNSSTWDVEDMLLIRRDMKEWFFTAESVEGYESSGLIGLIQFRYTPVSVNVGYEFGSVESFEYGANVADGNSDTMANGIPRPWIDQTRP